MQPEQIPPQQALPSPPPPAASTGPGGASAAAAGTGTVAGGAGGASSAAAGTGGASAAAAAGTGAAGTGGAAASSNAVPRSEPSFPDFLVIGCQKGATTSIFQLLKDASLVCGRCCVPPGDKHEKEAHYFDGSLGEWNNSSHVYGKYFTRAGGCTRWMDGTPAYLTDMAAPRRMQAVMPPTWIAQVKLLAVLREPISRDLSSYNMIKAYWLKHTDKDLSPLGPISRTLCSFTPGSFPTYAAGASCHLHDYRSRCAAGLSAEDYDAVATRCLTNSDSPSKDRDRNRFVDGFYVSALRNYFAVFPRDHLMVLNFDSMLAAQPDYIRRILSFYDLPPSPSLSSLPADNSPSFEGKLAKVDCATRDELSAVFAPANRALYRLLASPLASPLGPRGKQRPQMEPDFAPFEMPPCGA